MASEFDTYKQVKDTHNPETEEFSRHSSWLGAVKERELLWTAEGRGAGDVSYKITVVERWFKGLLAIAEPDHSFDVGLYKREPAQDGRGLLRTQYDAHLTPTQLVIVSGHTAEVDPTLSGEEELTQLVKPVFMTPQEAEAGFEMAMADADFTA